VVVAKLVEMVGKAEAARKRKGSRGGRKIGAGKQGKGVGYKAKEMGDTASRMIHHTCTQIEITEHTNFKNIYKYELCHALSILEYRLVTLRMYIIQMHHRRLF
jgi:hypothetical protein